MSLSILIKLTAGKEGQEWIRCVFECRAALSTKPLDIKHCKTLLKCWEMRSSAVSLTQAPFFSWRYSLRLILVGAKRSRTSFSYVKEPLSQHALLSEELVFAILKCEFMFLRDHIIPEKLRDIKHFSRKRKRERENEKERSPGPFIYSKMLI